MKQNGQRLSAAHGKENPRRNYVGYTRRVMTKHEGRTVPSGAKEHVKAISGASVTG